MADLSHLLGKKTSDIEKPKPFPIGHYLWTIAGFEIVESSQKKTPGVQLDCRMTEPQSDVDEDELAEVKNANERKQRMTFWITEDSLWRLKEFTEVVGVADDDKTLEEILPELTGCSFIAPIVHEVPQGSTDPIAKINENQVTADS